MRVYTLDDKLQRSTKKRSDEKRILQKGNKNRLRSMKKLIYMLKKTKNLGGNSLSC